MHIFRLDQSSLKSCAIRLFVAAFTIKLALAGFLIGRNHDNWINGFQTRHYDDTGYYRSGCKILKYHAFLKPDSEAPQRTVYRTPGYPFILAILVAVVGEDPFSLLIVQAMVLSAVPVVFFFILREMQLPPGWAWLFVLDPLTNILSASFMTEGWLILVLLLSLFCWLRADRLGWRFASLLLFCLALLIKPTAQFFLPVFLGLTLVHFRRRGWTIFFGVVATLPLVLWMCRNYTVCGEFLLSTQADAQIMAVETIKAKQQGVSDDKLIEWIVADWRLEHGDYIFDRIVDNKIDFAGVMSAYALAHPLEFARYHVGGMARILFGTARIHVIFAFRSGQPFSPLAARMFDLFMLGWYVILYAAVAWRFRTSWFRHPMGQLSLLFILYNLALIGVLAYTTGGGLKRMPFVALIYLLLAFSFAPASPDDKPLFSALFKRRWRGRWPLFRRGGGVETTETFAISANRK
jgi:hypothetical protein